MTGHELLAWLQAQSPDVLSRRVVRDDDENGATDIEPRTSKPIMTLPPDYKPFTVAVWVVGEEVIRL